MARKRKKTGNGGIFQTLLLISQFGISMLVPICICFFAGLLLDKLLNTSFLAILFFFIGALAGATSIYKLIKKKFENDKR